MQCPHPISIRNPKIDCTCSPLPDGTFLTPFGEVLEPRIEVPCGRCVICQNARRDAWATRLEMESRTAACTFFFTLTYADDFCPDELQVSDLQKFFKRFRKKVKCRYFACGEYGDRFQRPHYHFIGFFEKTFSRDEIESIVSTVWQFGYVQCREADRNSFRYVAKYCVKIVRDNPKDKQPPFAVMSRRPGISFEYFDKIQNFYHEYIVLENGSRQSLPRYNLEKLDPIEQVSIKRHRREFAEAAIPISDTEKELRLVNLERSLIRQYNRKYGK